MERTFREKLKRLVQTSGDDPDTNMLNLLELFKTSEIVPNQDKYYVFVYKAKTKGIVYDSNPFVFVDGVYRWGFTGTNLHLGQPRRYTWQETVSNLYEVPEEEVRLVLQLPTTNIQQS